MNKRGGYLLVAFMLAMSMGALFIPVAHSALSTKTIAAGKLFQPPSVDGWLTFSAQSTNTYSYWLNTVRVFQNLHMGTGDTFPELGLGSNSGNVTATAIDDKSVTVTLTVPVLGTTTGYLYAPDYYAPNSVTGALTSQWYDGNKTLVFTRSTTGSVTVSWTSPETDTVLWGRVFPDSFTVLGLLAIVVPAAFVMAVLGGLRDPLEIIGIVSFMILVSLSALIIANVVQAF